MEVRVGTGLGREEEVFMGGREPGSQEDCGNRRCFEQQNLKEGRGREKDKQESKTREEKIVIHLTLFGLESGSASHVQGAFEI